MKNLCLDHDIHINGPCPICLALAERDHATWERDAALDEVANLEFVVAQLEQKVRLLEAAQ